MSKHPAVPGTDLITIRNLLAKHERRRGRSLLATAIEDRKLPAQEADAFLRQVAMAGYLEWSNESGENLDWDLTDLGRRLLADSLGTRISREKAQAILGDVIKRARAINSDPDRLARVTEIRLFGSVLDADRDDYGDVDIEAEISVRSLPEDEVALAHAKIAAKVPRSWRDHFIRRLNAEDNYDSRNAFAALKKGMTGLSLSRDATRTLGCEFRRIYRFDLHSGEELSPDKTVTPRTTPPPKSAPEISASALPEQTVIRPVGLADPDEKIRSANLKLWMQELADTEARAWLGEEKSDGTLAPANVRKAPDQRFAGSQFLFNDWRDTSLTGLELFQRTLDWAALYDLPISRGDRRFMLRTYQNTRVANFHALMVQRVADRIDAYLAPDKQKGGNARWDKLGGSTFTTPRMVAAHYSLAVALARMLDETGLSGQTSFTAEFDLTGERRNFYPALPDLSGTSRSLQNSLSKVTFPQALMEEAGRHRRDYETHLPLAREIEVTATIFGKEGNQATGFAEGVFGETWNEDEDEETERSDNFLPGEEALWDLTDSVTEQLKAHVTELPGCKRLTMGNKAPVKA